MILLVDGNPICHAALATQDLSTKNGTPTGVVFGFLKTFHKIVSRFDDLTGLYVFWDYGKSKYRMDLYPDYKGQREAQRKKSGLDYDSMHDQIKVIEKLLICIGVPQIKLFGVEADDLIGVSSDLFYDLGKQVVIASNDKDFYQLIRGTDVVVYRPTSKKIINEEKATKAMKLPPSRLVEAKALAGDTSDNIPGIDGVGDGKAAKILNEYSIAELVTEEVRGKLKKDKKIIYRKIGETNPEDIKLWYKLSRIFSKNDLTDDEFEYVSRQLFYAPIATNTVKFAEEISKLEFNSIKKDLQLWLKPFKQMIPQCAYCECLKLENGGPVSHSGSIKADVMIVGRNPGPEEDMDDEPFMGVFGEQLDILLDEIGLATSDVYITNAVKCFYSIESKSEIPTPAIVSSCRGALQHEIDIVNPKLIITLGNVAMEAITGYDENSSVVGLTLKSEECNGIINLPKHTSVIISNNLSIEEPTDEDLKLRSKLADSVREYLKEGESDAIENPKTNDAKECPHSACTAEAS